MNKKSLAIGAIVYILLVTSLLLVFNHKRGSEYLYSYDLSTFNLDAGCISEGGSIVIDESSKYDGTFASSAYGQYRDANYTMVINYSCDESQQVHIATSSNLDFYVSLPSNQNEIPIEFTVWPSTDMLSVKFEYNGIGEFRINSIIIAADKPLYLDYEYYMILTLLLGILFPIGAWYAIKKKGFKRSEWTVVGVLGIVGVLSNYPIITRRYLWFGTDMRPHLMRIDGVSKALDARFFPTIIYSNYCNDYGELSCIYPDKFLYLPGFLRNRGVSLLSSYLTAHILINFATIVIMYFCAKYITGLKKAAVIAAVLYCFFPYRLQVMYRGAQALGNGFALLFFPIVFTAFYDLFFCKGKKWYLLSIGVAGITYSHVLSTVLCVIICAITFVFCVIALVIRKVGTDVYKGIWVNLSKCLITYGLICISTLVPFIYYYSQGLSTNKMSLDFMDSLDTFAWNFLSENGIYHLLLIAVCVAMFLVLRKKKVSFALYGEYYGEYCVYLTILGTFLFWMSTNLFPWKWIVNVPFLEKCLNMFQFSERFMLAGCSALCLGGAMLCVPIFEKTNNTQVGKKLSATFMIAILVFVVIGCVKINNNINSCEVLVPDRMTGNIYYRQLGYLPKGTDITFYESAVPNCGDWDSVENLSYIKNGTSIHYEYTCSSDNNYMEFPLFNYKGYHAYDEAGNELEIINSEHNRVTLNLVKSDERQVIDIKFIVHPVFTICGIVSLLGVIGLAIYIYISNKRLKTLKTL